LVTFRNGRTTKFADCFGKSLSSRNPPRPLQFQAAAAIRPQSISDGKAPELSLDQILQKIQRDIAEGRPIPLGPSSA
jgi:hypothetical protein